MIDYDILRQFGTTRERLREFFTAKLPEAAERVRLQNEEPDRWKKLQRDCERRKKYETKLQGWLQEHIEETLRHHSLYGAVDLAWDSQPILKRSMPLLMYAQGRVDIRRAVSATRSLPDGDKLLVKDSRGNVVGIDLPKMVEMNINLVRSVITRRVAAQAVKYSTLTPYFHYEPRSTTQLGKLRADLTSQRIEIMSDAYGYRHHGVQVFRDMLLYPNGCITFPRCSWERDVLFEKASPDPVAGDDGKPVWQTKAKVGREGVSWVIPHRSRVFTDKAHPASSLNTDSGCEYCGFWDATKWGAIANNPEFFNMESVSYSTDTLGYFANYPEYFSQYFSQLKAPNRPEGVEVQNDRKQWLGFYNGELDEAAVFLSDVFVKEVPKKWGWGDYPYPVWFHFKVAGDGVVVYADIMPSSPAAVFQYNCNDGRLYNVSLAHELMQFQDTLTNLFTQLLECIKADLFSVAVLNEDIFPDTDDGKKIKAEFQKVMSGQNFYTSMQVLLCSFEKLSAVLGREVTADMVFKVVRSAPNTAITEVLEAITRVINMAERLFVMSSHEQGQVASHEISATESNALSTSTDTMYNFISLGVDEGRAAMKKICFESMIACGEAEVLLPASKRYPKSLLEKAGFTVQEDDEDQEVGYVTVMGNKRSLLHDYIFTSRDGGNRAHNSQAATVLVQLLQGIGALVPEAQKAILSAMGKDKLFELMNTIFRLADAGVDLKLEVASGESNELVIEDEQQVMAMIQQLANAVKQNTVDLKRLAAQAVNLQNRLDDNTRISINYKDAPPSIRRQMEIALGLTPASAAESAMELEK
jgi:hypothetical protein